jgi:hypothetical protein
MNCNHTVDPQVVAADNQNGDTVLFQPRGSGYQIVMIPSSSPNVIMYFTMVPQSLTQSVLKLTTNPNAATVFSLIPYVFSFEGNNSGSNLYQIGTTSTNTLLGEASPSCATKDGLPIVDGFNFYVNAPNGMSSKSLFFILPYQPQSSPIPINPPPPIPINPPPSPAPSPAPSPSPSPMPSPVPSPAPMLGTRQFKNQASPEPAKSNLSPKSYVAFDIF